MSKRTDRAILIYPLKNVCRGKISQCFRFMSVSLTENILINPTLLLIININFQNSLWSQGYLQKGFIKYGHNLITYPQMRQVTSVLLSSSTAHHVLLSYLSLFILGLQNFLDLICLKKKIKKFTFNLPGIQLQRLTLRYFGHYRTMPFFVFPHKFYTRSLPDKHNLSLIYMLNCLYLQLYMQYLKQLLCSRWSWQLLKQTYTSRFPFFKYFDEPILSFLVLLFTICVRSCVRYLFNNLMADSVFGSSHLVLSKIQLEQC